MIASRYNIFIPLDDCRTLLFNSASAALAEIESENLETVRRILESPGVPRTPSEDQFYQVLCDGRFLVPGDIDELQQLIADSRRRRISRETLSLTIAPTLACNFRCDYCFEQHQASNMTLATEHALLRFAETQTEGAGKMLITWFGGEPTLRMSTVEHLQNQFRRIAERHSLEMLPSAMVTNGYRLNRELADRLLILGITDIQVTLDGPAPFHDARRKLAGGEGTYERIVSNLAEISTVLRVTIRVNIDRDNVDAAVELARDLFRRGVLPAAGLYFAQVHGSAEICADLCDRCFTTPEFAQAQTRFYQRLASEGLTRVEYPMLAPGGHCGADSANSWVVAPSGDIFKCWEEISMDRRHAVGTVHTPNRTFLQEQKLDAYASWDPMQLSECRDCTILPLCMGGCLRQTIQSPLQPRGACSSWKYNLEDMLRLHHRSDIRKEVTQ